MSAVLETPRLRLRELMAADLGFIAEMLAHPEVTRHYERRFDLEAAQAWLDRQLARYRRDGHGLWLVLERSSGHPVGQVGLALQDVEGRLEPEVGWLLHRPFWGLGYGTEATSATRDAAFGRWKYPHVISLIRPENAASAAVARRIGMQPGRQVQFHGFTTTVHGMPSPAGTGAPETAAEPRGITNPPDTP